MPATPRYLVLGPATGPDPARQAGALFDLPASGQVCLHADDPGVVEALVAGGVVVPARPPFLDASEGGIHGRYRPVPQLNLFFEPPLERLAEAIAAPLAAAGYSVAPVGS